MPVCVLSMSTRRRHPFAFREPNHCSVNHLKLDFAESAIRISGHESDFIPQLSSFFLSLAFGSLVAIVIPPLRGPDEISHFLRIYAYARGELLPAAEVDGRKGIFVDRELYQQLSFFRSAGELFATAREKDVRYGQIMALYRDSAGKIDDDSDQAAIFCAIRRDRRLYPDRISPYIPAAAIGRLLRLDFPDLLLLMRLFGIAAFTAVAAYAIRVSRS